MDQFGGSHRTQRQGAKTIFDAAGLSAIELTPIWELAFRRVVLMRGPQGPLPLETALRNAKLL